MYLLGHWYVGIFAYNGILDDLPGDETLNRISEQDLNAEQKPADVH